MHTFFMTPSTNCGLSQSTQTAYLIKSSSTNAKRPTRYLIKCHIMRYHGLRHRGLQSYSQLQLLHRAAASQSILSSLVQSTRGILQAQKTLPVLKKVCRVPFCSRPDQAPPLPIHFPTARRKCRAFFPCKATLRHYKQSIQMFHPEIE